MAEENDPSQKTEQPTPRRLEKAREKGQIPSSREVGHGFVLFALTLVVGAIIPQTFPGLVQSLARFLEHSHDPSILNSSVLLQGGKIFWTVFGLPALFVMAAALGAGFMQTRLKISFENIKPNISKLSPLSGLRRLFGTKALIEFLKNTVKIILVSMVSFWVLWPEIRQTAIYQSLDLDDLLDSLHHLVFLLFGAIVLMIALLAIVDYAWQKFHFIRMMRMSRQEIKEETKEQEGDPHLKARLKQIRQERARQRMMQRIPEATMIIANPTHYAIALKYETGTMAAPQVIAKGTDFIAQRIRDLAEEHEVPIVENPTLARALYTNVEIDEQIPLEYYEIVAKIIRQLLSTGKIKLNL